MAKQARTLQAEPAELADEIVRAAIEARLLSTTGGVAAFHALVVKILRG